MSRVRVPGDGYQYVSLRVRDASHLGNPCSGSSSGSDLISIQSPGLSESNFRFAGRVNILTTTILATCLEPGGLAV